MAAYTPSAQLKLTNVAYVRLMKKGKRFEIACYRNKVLSWRNKMESDITEVLQIDTVFTNVSKGMLASAKDLMDVFGTADQKAVCHEILDKGELQVSEKERGALYDSMIRDIATIVADKSINPENNRPYTITLIQNAIRQIHYSISINKSAKSQALEVIRKLKDVMPIARASMLLRVICPAKNRDDMSTLLTNELGIPILKTQDSADAANSQLDIRIDPELFRKVEDSVQAVTRGAGRLDVLLFRDSTPAVAVKPTVPQTSIGEQVTSSSRQDEEEDKIVKKKSAKKESLKAVKEEHRVSAISRKMQFLALDEDSEEDQGVKEYETGEIEDELSVESVVNDEESVVDESRDLEQDSDEDSSVEAIGIVTKADKRKQKKKKAKAAVSNDSSTQIINESTRETVTAANTSKKSKKAKRLEKEEKKEKQEKIEVLRSRIGEERLRAQKLASKTSEDVSDLPPPPTTLPTGPPVPGASQQPATAIVDASSKPAQSCNTCGGSFPDAAAYRNHFRSEWHRHNLKRKLKGLPIVPSEDEFAALPIEEVAI